MISKFEEIKALLIKDKRLLEVTVLFNGQNLKEQFPDLSWEDRAALARFAHSLTGRLDQDTSQEEKQVSLSDEIAPAIEPESKGSAIEDTKPKPDKIIQAPEQDITTPARGQQSPSADQLNATQRAKPQGTPQPAPEADTAVQPVFAPSAARPSSHDKRLYWAGITAIVVLGAVLIALRMPWLTAVVLDWVSGKAGTSVNQVTQQAHDAPKAESSSALGAGGEPIQAVPKREENANPPSAGSEPNQSLPTPPLSSTGPAGSQTSGEAAGSTQQSAQAITAADQATPAEPESPLASEGEATTDTPSANATNPDQVREAQSNLAKLGYDTGPIDGILGPLTSAAIKSFQQEHNLPVDGVLSAALLESLKTAKPR